MAATAGEQGWYVSGRTSVATINSTVTRGRDRQQHAEPGAEHTDNLWSAYAESGYVLPLSADSRLTPYAASL